MTKKLFLFEVTQTTSMIVVAENEKEARRTANDCSDDALSDSSPDIEVSFCREITDDKSLDHTDWDRNCIPYGSDDDKTVGDILDTASAATFDEEAAKRQMALPLPGDGEKKS
jgi:hypothetical protein